MNTTKTTSISNLLKQIDIVALVKNYINLSKKGQNYWGVCPFHNDSSPSLSVSEKKQFFKCFACNHSGNAIKFVMDFKKINFYEAIKEIEQTLSIDLGVHNLNINEHDLKLINLMNLAKDTYEGFLFRDENADKLEYLLNRKISKSQIEKFGIGYAVNQQKKLFEIAINKDNIRGVFLDKSELFNLEDLELAKLINVDQNGEIHDFFKNRIMIPIFDQTNNVIAFSGRAIGDELPKYINSPTTQLFKKDEVLYNMNNIDKSKHSCYLVEGFMDLYALDAVGVANPLATMGTAFSDKHIKLLLDNKITDIILCFDNDQAGLEATIKTGEKIGRRLNVFTLKPKQTKHKDFNDVLVHEGIDELAKIVSNTIHFSMYWLEQFLSNCDNTGEANKLNNFKEAISIVRRTGNGLYLIEYKKLISSYLNIDEEIVANELANINFNNISYSNNTNYKPYYKKEYSKNSNYTNKTYNQNKETFKKTNYSAKNITIERIYDRIVKINNTLFLAAAFSKKNFNIINTNYTIIEFPVGIAEMFESLNNYYSEHPEIDSIYENRNDFLNSCTDQRLKANMMALFQTFNPKFKPFESSVRKSINENKLNDVLYNMCSIQQKLYEDESITPEDIIKYEMKLKTLQDKKIELQKILYKK